MNQNTELHITDQRMLQVMEYCIAHKLRDTTTIKGWCMKVGIAHTNIDNVRKGHQQFRKDHILQACTTFGISADYIYGLTDKMFRTEATTDPITRIREALNEIEQLNQR